MKQYMIVILLLLCSISLSAARKALVIGNADYEEARLRNPVNDAILVADKLTELGFAVTKVTNADQRAMDEALNSFVSGLTNSDEAVFYYSGHGANVQGENFLIPVGRTFNDQEELKYYAFNCNLAMERLQRARISVMVLDACRDNPFKGVRSSSKGLANMQAKAGSQYIIFATEQGQTAADGSGNHSPFTESFVSYLDEPLKIEDLMKLVTQDVKSKTSSRQIPWTSGNLIEDFYFSHTIGNAFIAPSLEEAKLPKAQAVRNYGWIMVSSGQEADVYLDGSYKGRVSDAVDLKISDVTVGSHSLEVRTPDRSESKSLYVNKNQESRAQFNWTPDNMIYVEGGSFMMGSNSDDEDEKPVHRVTLRPFYIGKFEVTQVEYAKFMQPSPNWAGKWGLGDNYPAYNASWYASLKYCNLRSLAEGLTPCYRIAGSTNPTAWGPVPTSKNATWDSVVCDFNANGYRLPTEAEWEFAARGGTMSKGYQYAGSNDPDNVAWYSGNIYSHSGGSKLVGTLAPNELGICDMGGNLWEWCWDWYSSSYYSSSPKDNPTGPKTGEYRLVRGASWGSESIYCRASNRGYGSQTRSNEYFGFRLCRTAK